MSQQRKRHLDRQPIEEMVRVLVSALVGDEGSVEVERHSYDWRDDDLLVWVRLKHTFGGTSLGIIRQKLAEEMHGLLLAGKAFQDWTLVAERSGKEVFTLTGTAELKQQKSRRFVANP